MLNEVGANVAVINTLPQTAYTKVGIGKNRLISLLNNQPIEKTKALRKRIDVAMIAIVISASSSDRQCRGDAFQIDSGRISWRVRLMIVYESAGLVLLITEEPISNLEQYVGKMVFTGDLPPFTQRLQQP